METINTFSLAQTIKTSEKNINSNNNIINTVSKV